VLEADSEVVAAVAHESAELAFAGRPGVVIDAPLSVREAGFSLHAATRAGPADEQGRQALLKYILRPPLATERLLPGPDGLVRIALKKPFSDGTVAVDLDPLSQITYARCRHGHGAAILVAGTRGNAQERARPQDPAHGTARVGASRVQASSVRPGVLLPRWQPHQPLLRGCNAQTRLQAGRAPNDWIARASAHFLLTPRDARRGAESDPRASRSLDAQHDPSVHALGAHSAPRSHRSARLWAAGGQR